MCPQLPLVDVHAHTCALGRRRRDKPDKNLEKNSDPPIINLIIREKKSSLNFAANFQTQMCPQSPLVDVYAHTHALGRRRRDKPDENLEKNLDSPIINPIIGDQFAAFSGSLGVSNVSTIAPS